MNVKDIDLLCCPNCKSQLNFVLKKKSVDDLDDDTILQWNMING